MDAADRKEWLADLKRTRSASLDAPSWLWNSIVDLVAAHEAAYLEHCRRHALNVGELRTSNSTGSSRLQENKSGQK